ncbi:MAG: LysR family transcriptional regulator [Myxococcales bacterium]
MMLMTSTGLLPRLHVFLGVARLRSFSGAGRELGVSPSAVSQAVRQVEEQLHVVLPTRTTRSVSLTDAGKRLVESAGPALAEAGMGLAYVAEPTVAVQLRTGRLRRVLDSYAPTVPGFFLYFPSRAKSTPSLRAFVDAAKELATRAV